MGKTSIVDNYYQLINNDRDYIRDWIKLYGTEVKLMSPKNTRQVQDYQKAYGRVTFANNPEMYDTKITNLVIEDMDWGKIQNNVTEQYQVVSPDRLFEGCLIQVDRLGRTYTFEITEMIERVQDYSYKCLLRLTDMTATNT